MELTDEQIATIVKYCSAKRHNLYGSVQGEYDINDEQRAHLNGEIDKLTDVINTLEAERDRRRYAVTW